MTRRIRTRRKILISTQAAMVTAHLPPPSEGNIVMVCGPPPMYKAICGPKKFEKGKPPKQGPIDGVLKALGYTEAMCFKF